MALFEAKYGTFRNKVWHFLRQSASLSTRKYVTLRKQRNCLGSSQKVYPKGFSNVKGVLILMSRCGNGISMPLAFSVS